MSIQRVIRESVLDAEIDPRVDGILDIAKSSHLKIFEEHFERNLRLESTGPDGEYCTLDEAGKYPERQAYNKEGWLVTFPSKEYKDKAVKKGTHYASDPTHGKGGMNLYYKSKGKQKRQTQQDVSATEPTDQQPASQPQQAQTSGGNTEQPASVIPTDTQAPTGQQKPDGQDQSGGNGSLPKSDSNGKPSEAPTDNAQPAADGSSLPSSGQDKGSASPEKSKESPQQASAPAPAPVVAPKTSITIDFAKYKNWSPTPYGEWRDERGEVVAVVSLSGEVAPLKAVIRDELKIFASRKTSSNG